MGNIIKINKLPKSLDKNVKIAIDTNIILWTFYGRVSTTQAYQKLVYPPFLANLISNGNPLFVTSFCLNEVFHVIEKNECKIYNRSLPLNAQIGLKHFRCIPEERKKLKAEIELIYNQLRAIPNVEIVGSIATQEMLNDFLDTYSVRHCEFFDYLLMEYSDQNNYCILTDDSDFEDECLISDVYTANPKIPKLQISK